MSTVTIRFNVSQKVRERALVEEGHVLPHDLEVALELQEATKEQREAILPLLNWGKKEIDLRYHVKFDTATPSWDEVADACRHVAAQEEERKRKNAIRAARDTIATLKRAMDERSPRAPLAQQLSEEALQYLPANLRQEYLTAWERFKAALPQFEAEEKARKETERKEYEERERKIREERERWKADKLAWIEKHGSDYLKTACLDEGYDCTRRYMQERAAVEFPGFVVDFNDTADWKDRSCPSEEALAIVRQIREAHPNLPKEAVKVVWLTDRPSDAIGDDDYYDEPFEGSEAVVIWHPEVFRDKWLVREA